LSRFREALAEDYPGYDPGSFDPTRIPKIVRELERAISEPKLAATDAGQGIALYLEYRRQASEQAVAAGLSPTGFQAAKAAQPLREWLRRVGAAVSQDHPAFAPVWERVFDNELKDDDPTEVAA
jgi:hypothetical protein